MARRTFVKFIGATGVTVLLPAGYTGCGEREPGGLRPWHGPEESSDVRMNIVAYAILAPNPHNKQPWLVDLRGEGIELHVDPSRLLPQTDPLARQIMIGQGTFLELVSIAATHYGYEADITLFPNGIDPLENIGMNPVARVSLTRHPDRKEDGLFASILARHTNRRVYGGPPLTSRERTTLEQSYNDQLYPLRIFAEQPVIQNIAGMMTEAMRIETYTPAMHAETVDMMRFSEEEIETRRDGFSLPNLGITGITLFFAKLFVSRASAHEESFLERTVESIREGAMSSRAIALMSSRTATRIDEVIVGRHFAVSSSPPHNSVLHCIP